MRHWLYVERRKKGFTQQELAKRVGCSAGTISAIERGERDPNMDNAKKILEVLDLDENKFFREESA